MTELSELETRCLTIEVHDAVARVVLDAPPVNVMTWRMVRELRAVAAAADADPDVRVLVFTSAHPEFWLAHFDVEAILRLPVDAPAVPTSDLHPFHALCLAYRSLRTPTLAVIDGRVGGGELDARTAESWGWLNRALPAAELGPAADGPLFHGLRVESGLFDQCLGLPHTRPTLRRFLDLGGQTAAGERRVGNVALEATRRAAARD